MTIESQFNWGDDIIDSSDITYYLSELESEYEQIHDEYNYAAERLEDIIDKESEEYQIAESLFETAEDDLNDYDNTELEEVRIANSQGESFPDWGNGAILILDSHFVDYIKSEIESLYPLPVNLNDWPWNCLEMDYDQAADQALQDYGSICVGGETYYVRY